MGNEGQKKFHIGLLPRLIIAIVLGVVVGTMARSAELPLIIQIGATFNSIFGNFLGFCIPLIIIGFVVSGIAELGEGAGKTLGLTVLIAYASTLFAGLLAYFVDVSVFPSFLKVGSIVLEDAQNAEETMLKGLFSIDMPPLMGVMTALLLSFIFGIGIAVTHSTSLKNGFSEVQHIIEKLVAGVLIPLLPLHVYGIFANMTYAGTVMDIMSVFVRVFAIIILLHVAVILIQYTIAGTAAGKNPIKLIRRMLPAYFTAIGTQSSAATIPVTVACTKSNGVSDRIAEFVCPLCATIHLSGSTITLTSCSIALMMLNGMDVTLGGLFPFILMLGITMVAAPGVPGGAVMAALGILSSMLGFNDSMLNLMIALYIAQDSFGTACNVTGDGAIAVFMDVMTRGKQGQASA
ncbi:dicarboxylate/amino acid:cation symporter [Fretibacterium fastidiosum]|uniref:Na+/H+-dicarboxylate symporters n=1 Tax=Fretibacterium fastidiosum TaxID=651822 RepID=A0AB94IV49_9BACT|nr:dicarboxylate/amino acid:cation symporter [Fretibacterium fastidiosum]CBL27629.1 Na+/H+-dicarboxylate symporters [Fretibacterium fastidiosum]